MAKVNRLNKTEYWFSTVFFPFVDKITWQFPLTLLSIPFVLHDWHAIIIVPVLAIIDLSIFELVALFVDFRNSLKINKNSKDKTKCLSGNLKIYRSQLVDQFQSMVSGYGPSFIKNLKNIGLKKEVIVLLSDKSDFSNTNFSSYNGESIIVLKDDFDEHEMKHIYILAHEFGHIYHVYKRTELYSLPVYLTIIQILLLMCAIFYGAWLGFFIVLPINVILFLKYSFSFESYSETAADLEALHIIESFWDENEMHIAANVLVTKRIINLVRSEQNKKLHLPFLSRLSMRHCIDLLSPFVFDNDRNELIKRSENRSKRVLNDPLLSSKQKSKTLSHENYIRKRIISNKDIFWHSASEILLRDSDRFYTWLYYFSLIITMVAFYYSFNGYTYNWGCSVLWLIPIILILLIFINFIITIASWIKKRILMTRIGL